ncbi:MAG TPA: M56 family metallopeptidase [Verrucomicrobiae bacterium]
MDSIIERLNVLGTQAILVAWPILWQSSLLIAVMLVIDWATRNKLRPGVRYVLWLVVLMKLALPPSLALPTSVAWWVRPQARKAQPAGHAPAVVTYEPATLPGRTEPVFLPESLRPRLTVGGVALAGSAGVSLALFGFLLWRWRQAARQAVSARPAPEWLADLQEAARASAGLRRRVAVRLVRGPISPALFGLFRPVILLPDSLIERLSVAQLRSVLLHELIHLRRGDVWVNCGQTLLQVVYWWHPLLWVANSRIRRVREEAVDEAVMLALRGDAESYAPTLVAVARLALPRPLASVGLVGILESHGALRQRIERLLDFRPPTRAGVTLMSMLCVAAFGAAALPMGQAPDNPTGDAKFASGDSTQIPPSDGAGKEKAAGARNLVQDGKLLYELGKIDEAEKKLMQALQLDPREQAAYYYLNLIKETRAKQRPAGRLRVTTSGRQRIYNRLDTLRLDRVQFDAVPLSGVVETLAKEAKRQDPSGDGINLILSRATSATNDTQVQDVGGVTIRIVPSLINIRLADVLDAVVKTADKPIKYSIEDYGVVFSFKGTEPPALYTRMIKVDPNTFENGLRSVTGNLDPGDKQPPLKLLRNFLASISVDLAPPKSIFWNDREGTVLIRATLQDLDTIETAIQVLTGAPPQLNIRAWFIEVSEQEEAAFWQKHQAAKQSPSAVRTLELSAEEAQRQLDEWKSKGGADVLSQSSVTTLSGRQVQAQVVDLKTIVTYTNSSEGHWEIKTNVVALGPILDVLPTISADTLRIDLALTASVNEFLGYDDPGPFVVSTDPVGQPQPATLPIPRFRLRQLPVTASVWDGQTLVIGGALEQGRPADTPGDNKKRLLVMVTPTVVDPAGNRTHADEDVERARSSSGQWRPPVSPGPTK